MTPVPKLPAPVVIEPELITTLPPPTLMLDEPPVIVPVFVTVEALPTLIA